MGLVLAYKKSSAQPSFQTGAVVIGSPSVGQTLEVTYTVLRAKTVTVQWYRRLNSGSAPVAIPGATGTTYTLTGNENLHQINAVVTASNNAGAVQSTSSYTAAVTSEAPPEPPTVTSAAAISGTVEVGSTLTVSVTFSGADSVAYQWYSYTSAGKAGAVALGTSNTQALTAAEDGKYIGCEATGTNTTGDTVSVATVVGPVQPESDTAPVVVSAAVISLDEGADGYNEGEYIICDAEFSGWTGTPTFTWYRCTDATKSDGEVIQVDDGEGGMANAGVAAIRPLFVSEPNHWRGALFLDTAFSLSSTSPGNKRYVYCIATASNSVDDIDSESAAVGPIGAIQGAQITQAMVGDGPYYLPLNDTTYYLKEDIRTTGTGIIMNKAGQKLNLNGKTLTFDDDAPTALANGDFGTGDLTGWDVTNAPDAAIYASSAFEDDFNTARRFHNPNSCFFSSAIHADPIVPQYIEQTGIELTRWAWYSFTVQWNEPTNTRITIQVIHDGQVVRENTSRRSGTAYQGHRPIEVVFQAYHNVPTYSVRVIVAGEVGLTSGAYIHYAKLARTRAAGVYVSSQHNDGGPKVADAVSIESGGSGYADGTYANLLSTRHSGESLPTAASYPYLDVTVSGGVVTEVAISGGKRGYQMRAHDLKLTVPNTLLGGTGSGLVVNVDGYRTGGRTLPTFVFADTTNFWYGATIPPLDHTTRYNTGGDGIVIKNGSITQGADNGSACYGVYLAGKKLVNPNLRMHRVSVAVGGYHSYALQREGGSSTNLEVYDCHVSCMHGSNPDRHNYGGAIENVDVVLARTTVLHSGFTAFRPGDYGSIVLAYGNTFRNRSYYNNQSSVPIVGNGAKFHDNLMDNTGEYWGRCCHCRVDGDVEVYNNVFKMQPTRYTAEYNGPEQEGEHAIQLETSASGKIADIHDNVFEAYSSGGLTTGGETNIGSCFRCSRIYASANVIMRNNTLRAIASGPGYAAIYWMGAGNTIGLDMHDNVVETNSILFGGQEVTTMQVSANDIAFTATDGNKFRPLMIGYTNNPSSGVHVDVDIIDPNMSPEDFSALTQDWVWRKPRYGDTYEPGSRGGYRIKWTTTIATGSEGAAVVIKDSGGSTVASGTSGANGNFVAQLQQFYISGNSPTNTENYTVQVNANTPVAFTADSVKTVSAPA